MSVQSDYPIAGKVYRHYKGPLYKVVGVGYDMDLIAVVIYRSINTNELWVRKLNDWRSPTMAGMKRFTQVEENDAGS